MSLQLDMLVDKLDRPCRAALEAAAARCVGQTHYNVEIEHYLIELLERSETGLAALVRALGGSPVQAARELGWSVERFQRGNGRVPVFSPSLMRCLRDAWLIASVQRGRGRIDAGALLLALLDAPETRALLRDSTAALTRLDAAALRRRLRAEDSRRASPHAGAHEAHEMTHTTHASTAREPRPEEMPGPLERFTRDLTADARAGRLDPILGRDAEIRQLVDVLTRRRQNNPLLTGEAGVGKTAVVEGFAQRVAAGEVPPALQRVSVRSLDVGALTAGASLRGEFESRLTSIIDAVAASPRPVILFIDEAHTLIGAGGRPGQGDAANLLKPALARGALRTIAATTWAEYKQHVEKDPALARRFQVVPVDEPSPERAAPMLRGLVARLEKHHGVRITDGAVRSAVSLSHRYVSGRRLPDKAVGVLDTACARVAIARSGPPASVEDARRQIEDLQAESRRLVREQATGADHAARLADLEAALPAARERLRALGRRWRDEQDRVEQICALEARLLDRLNTGRPGEAALQVQLDALKVELARIQGDEPMVPRCVDEQAIAAVISDWTGVPVGRMMQDEIQALLSLETHLADRVIGQRAALSTIARRVQTSRAGLEDPGRPVGVFLLAGPSGVGKTETAMALAERLYGGADHAVVINMSEYQEAHSVAGLKGAPPGYVGYGKGGVLTEAVRRSPHSLVLLDEVEKAHPDVMELFYQVFDKGTLEDAEGARVDFRNTVILLTSNLGDTILAERWAAGVRDPQALVAAIRPALLARFKPALLGRMTVVPYAPLGAAELRQIAGLKLARVQRRFQEQHRAALRWDPALTERLAARCTEAASGARNLDRLIEQTLLPDLAREILGRMANGRGFSRVQITLGEGDALGYRFDDEPPAGAAPEAEAPDEDDWWRRLVALERRASEELPAPNEPDASAEDTADTAGSTMSRWRRWLRGRPEPEDNEED